MSEWITTITERLGYGGVMLLMFLENIFPPIPSEVVMPMAGFTARTGELTFFGVLVAGSTGSLLGIIPWYYLGRWLGEERFIRWIERHGKWLTISTSDIRRTQEWFAHHGNITVLVCRMVPGVRTLISVPAGFARMSVVQFLIYSAIGTVAWTAMLAWLGWLLGENYHLVDRYGGWVGTAVVAGLVVWWLVRLYRRRGTPAGEAR